MATIVTAVTVVTLVGASDGHASRLSEGEETGTMPSLGFPSVPAPVHKILDKVLCEVRLAVTRFVQLVDLGFALTDRQAGQRMPFHLIPTITSVRSPRRFDQSDRDLGFRFRLPDNRMVAAHESAPTEHAC